MYDVFFRIEAGESYWTPIDNFFSDILPECLLAAEHASGDVV